MNHSQMTLNAQFIVRLPDFVLIINETPVGITKFIPLIHFVFFLKPVTLCLCPQVFDPELVSTAQARAKRFSG